MKPVANRKSKIELLPEEIRNALNLFIRSGGMTQKEILETINEMIDEAGLPDDTKLSRTGFNRYAKRMEDKISKLRESREIAELWIDKLGEAPTSDVGKLLQEFVRTMAFETSMKLMEDADEKREPVAPKILNQMALVSQRVEQAAMMSIKREKEIRAAFAAEAADKAEKIVKQAGVSAATAEDIKKQILGIAS